VIQRIFTLSRYLFKRLLFSLPGLLYLLLAAVYYKILFDPGQHTPGSDYFIVILGIFGAGFTFLVTLSITARANEAASYTMFIRLPSRIEYLTATLVSSLLFASLVQLLLAVVALFFAKVEISGEQLLEIPPLWLATNVVIATLAIHASDFASSGCAFE